ncbi:Vps53-like protein [Dunaliella salina]|uniref:Vps53-like protein n=1 Tax=Dunaliella salina TaxID=3046 RepID=A0ABQ7GR47_DUNSA|nr:Vps53-like protein [Dunaliella salina]|eukprot:KAF5837073.1 Vps53-like protein [Dunaliella salina]
MAESELQNAVLDDFKLLLGTVDVKVSQESLERLGAGCLVVDALGPKVRDQLMDWVAEREMKIYQLFIASGGADTSKLDRFERRFQWFRNRLEERKAEWSIFPEQWRVPQVLCLMFCKITKAHLKRVLSDEEAQGQGDIGPLIKAVVATNKFEKDMAARFGGGTGDDDAASELAAAGNAGSVEARKRLERVRDQRHQQQQEQQEGNDLHKQGSVGSKAQREQESIRTKFEGSISEAFEGVLHLYVAEEERELVAYMEACLREDAERQWKPGEEDLDSKILPSANKMFLKIRSSLTRCVKLISRGQALLQLSEAFKRVLQRYSQALLDRLPRTASGAAVSSVTYPCVGTDWHVRMPKAEEQVVCRILHTSEFCRETLEALGSAIAKDIKPAWSGKVDMSDVEGSFQALASQCMNALVLGLNTRLDAALQDLMHTKWDSIESPGDHSPYVDQICKVLMDMAPLLGDALDQTSLSFFCDKAGRVFMPRFHDAVGSVKRISDKGAMQLSIDCDAVLRALLEFPRLAYAAKPQPGSDHDADLQALAGTTADEDAEDRESNPFAPYSVYVQREMGTLNNMMKVVQSKPENLVSTFMLLIPPALQNTVQFARICELKHAIGARIGAKHEASNKRKGRLAASTQGREQKEVQEAGARRAHRIDSAAFCCAHILHASMQRDDPTQHHHVIPVRRAISSIQDVF